MPLTPELQKLFDDVQAAHPQGLSLDELAAFLIDKPVTYGDIETIIGAFSEIGVDLVATEPERPEDLRVVLVAARAIAVETGQRPSVAAIATRTSLSPVAVLRALRLGRALGTEPS